MGRGRQKAKQTKVARRLKYYSPDTDYDALQRELSAHDEGHPHFDAANGHTDGDSDDDGVAGNADGYDAAYVEDVDDDWAAGRS